MALYTNNKTQIHCSTSNHFCFQFNHVYNYVSKNLEPLSSFVQHRAWPLLALGCLVKVKSRNVYSSPVVVGGENRIHYVMHRHYAPKCLVSRNNTVMNNYFWARPAPYDEGVGYIEFNITNIVTSFLVISDLKLNKGYR